LNDIAIIERRPIESLKRHPDNPRLGDVDAIKESIRVNGWHGAVVIQHGTDYILAGNHRTEAALELYKGNFEPSDDQSEQDYENEKAKWKALLARLPVHVMEVTEDTARRILLADNKTSDLATYDDLKLLRLTAQVGDPETAIQIITDPNSNADEVAEALRVLATKPKKGALRGTGYKQEDVEQLALALEGGMPQEWGSQGTAAEAKERYEASGLRQFVLIMSAEEYDRVLPLLREIGDKHGLETNTDVFMWLLERYGQPTAATA
jgi:ParB-like chromosome segregation protein Spo0J